MAVALHCLSRFCATHNLRHPALDAFLDDLWEFPVIESERWLDWEKNHPALVATALGDPWPVDFEAFLNGQRMRSDDFRRLLALVVEIAFGSFYCAADNTSSLEFLSEVLKTVAQSGVNPPPAKAFAASRFADGHGWGKKLTVAERDAWRMLEW